MKVITHRGYWKSTEEKNTAVAFKRSFSLGFGTETDIRDYKGELVISHDIADEHSIPAARFFEIYNKYNTNLYLALNIKADGLQVKLKNLLDLYKITNYFVFDMSVPDAIGYLSHGFNTFTRQSEYELQPSFYSNANGIWMDCFLKDWIEERHIAEHLEAGKQVCLVSPDLHKRDYLTFWERLARMSVVTNDNLMLCTDYPEKWLSLYN